MWPVGTAPPAAVLVQRPPALPSLLLTGGMVGKLQTFSPLLGFPFLNNWNTFLNRGLHRIALSIAAMEALVGLLRMQTTRREFSGVMETHVKQVTPQVMQQARDALTALRPATDGAVMAALARCVQCAGVLCDELLTRRNVDVASRMRRPRSRQSIFGSGTGG